MFKIYNSKAISRTERFTNAIFVGVLASLLCIGVTFLMNYLEYFTIVYVGYGLIIGYAIQYFGKGVHLQFSLLSIGLTAFVIIFSDLLFLGFNFSGLIPFLLNDLSGIIYRAIGLYLAFRYARLVS